MCKIHPQNLKVFNGKNGNPGYIAYQGKVYDVSQVALARAAGTRFFTTPGQILPQPSANSPTMKIYWKECPL